MIASSGTKSEWVPVTKFVFVRVTKVKPVRVTVLKIMQFLQDMKLLHTFCRKMTNNQERKSAYYNQKKILGEGLFTF